MTDQSVAQAETDVAAVAANARRVLTGNRQQGVSEWGGRTYNFVCPSTATVPLPVAVGLGVPRHRAAGTSIQSWPSRSSAACCRAPSPTGSFPTCCCGNKPFHARGPGRVLDRAGRPVLYGHGAAAGARPRGLAGLPGDQGSRLSRRGAADDAALLPLAQGVPRPRRRPPDRHHPARRVGPRR